MDGDGTPALSVSSIRDVGAGSLPTPVVVQAVRSLLIAGDRLSSSGPESSEAGEVFFGCVDELTNRGIDGDSLLRLGLHGEVISPLLAGVMVRTLLPRPEHVLSAAESAVVAQWQDVLRLPSCASDGSWRPQDLQRLLRSLTDPLFAWVLTAPTPDLYTLTPPTVDDLHAARVSLVADPVVMGDYRWLVQRFCASDLSEWDTQSLHREHRWADGEQPPPCPAHLMGEQRIDHIALAFEIARRAVEAPEEQRAEEWTALAARMQNEARRLLAGGRHAEAAALFEFAVNQRPDDASFRNNLGFCLIPTDATSALFHLEKAHQLRYGVPSINFHNRIMCHRLLSQERIARNLAEEYWCTYLDQERLPVPATLWDSNDCQEISTFETVDARKEVLRLGLLLSDEDHARWQSRLDALRP